MFYSFDGRGFLGYILLNLYTIFMDVINPISLPKCADSPSSFCFVTRDQSGYKS